jgi:hypothetical protein
MAVMRRFGEKARLTLVADVAKALAILRTALQRKCRVRDSGITGGSKLTVNYLATRAVAKSQDV